MKLDFTKDFLITCETHRQRMDVHRVIFDRRWTCYEDDYSDWDSPRDYEEYPNIMWIEEEKWFIVSSSSGNGLNVPTFTANEFLKFTQGEGHGSRLIFKFIH